MDSLLSRMLATRRVLRRTFGVSLRALFAAGAFVLLRSVVALGMALDRLFSRRLREQQVTRPIVLVGNPRTGTTFLQRFLCDQGYGAGMEVWQMLYPSLVLQRFLRPFLPLLEAVSPAKYHSTKAHATSLTSVETDDVAVLFRHFDGFFLYGFFLAFDEEDHLPQFEPSVRDTSQRDFDWLEELWRRNLASREQDTAIAKLFSLGPRLPAFLRRFPDARILYMARDPLDVIPSGMSLVTGVLDNAFGFWKLPDDLKARWFERMYAAFVELLRRFHADWTSGAIAREQVYVVRYDRMMQDFDGLMDEIHAFLGVEPTEAQRRAIALQAEKQRAWKSGHKYDLSRFGLDEAQIREDCAFFYDTFLTPLELPAPLTSDRTA